MKYNEPITAAEINGHREDMEVGAGMARYSQKSETFTLVRDMEHDKMYDKYIRTSHRSPFFLFHSRMPSAGSIVPENIQPFASKRLIFCHNGTIEKERLMWTLAGLNEQFDDSMSDSLLLFKILNRLPLSSGLTLLKTIKQNFVLASMQLKRIYVLGMFDIEKKSENAYDFLLTAKNDWTKPQRTIETDFNGRILFFERKEKWNGGNYWQKGDSCK